MNRTHWIAVGAMAGGLLLILGLGWNFLLRPLGKAYTDELARLDGLKTQLQTTRQRALQFEKFKAEAENVRRDLDFYNRRLASELRASELYSMIDGIGHSFNFSAWSFEASPRAKSKMPGVNLDEVDITAAFTTDYERLGRFTNACLSQTRMIVPEGFILTREVDAQGRFQETLKAEYKLAVLVSPESKK